MNLFGVKADKNAFLALNYPFRLSCLKKTVTSPMRFAQANLNFTSLGAYLKGGAT